MYDHAPAGELKKKTDTATGKVTLYEYDELGSLRSVLLPDGRSVTYTVDGAGRRVRKLVNGTPAQGYLYRDGLRVVAELDGQNGVIARYVWGTRANIPDYVVKGGSTYRIISDHLGSPRLLVDTQSGKIVWQANYDEWGNQTMIVGQADSIPFGFAGGLADSDTGLIRFGVRDYDPQVGRWTAKDPLLFGGGSTNLYEYAGGDPVNAIDPTGRDIWIEGPSGSEPSAHLSISIGDPFGSYKSFAFRIKDFGSVYQDTSAAGPILALIDTSPEEDAQAERYIREHWADDSLSPYFYETCRSYSWDKFRFFEHLFRPRVTNPVQHPSTPLTPPRDLNAWFWELFSHATAAKN